MTPSLLGAVTVLNGEIAPMDLRSVSDTDPVLAPRYLDADGFYSIRPLRGFKRDASALRGGEKDPLRYRTRFKNPATGDMMEAGVVQGGPSVLDKVSLSKLRGDFVAGFRGKKGVQVVGSDLFLYDRYTCVQLMAKGAGKILLVVLVFDQPGEFLEVTYSIGEGRYRSLGRQVESSLASIEWPDYPVRPTKK